MLLKSKTILIVLLSIFVFGCSPSELFTLTPDREKVDVEDGTEIAFLEDDFVYSNIEFEAWERREEPPGQSPVPGFENPTPWMPDGSPRRKK